MICEHMKHTRQKPTNKLGGATREQVIRFTFTLNILFRTQMISRRPSRKLIVLHPKQNLESEVKWHTCFSTVPRKFSCSWNKGLSRTSCQRYL